MSDRRDPPPAPVAPPPPAPAAPVEAATASPPRRPWHPVHVTKRLVRKADNAMLRILSVPRPGGVGGPAPGGHGGVVHHGSPMRGPHLLGRAYCKLRKSARKVDNVLAAIARPGS